jgi:hypothetical protein
MALLVAPAFAHAETVDTRIGKLELETGYPSKATAERLFDEMDFQRATQAFIWARRQLRAASSTRQTIRRGIGRGDARTEALK